MRQLKAGTARSPRRNQGRRADLRTDRSGSRSTTEGAPIAAAKGAAVSNAANSASNRRIILAHDSAEHVKELTALHSATRLLAEPAAPLELLPRFVTLLPPAWQYPEITAGRVTAGELDVRTNNFRNTRWRQGAEFPMPGGQIGAIEIVYLEERKEQAEGPFLAEERLLLESLANLLTSYFYRIHAGGDRVPATACETALREAQQANLAKDQFLATLSHELRTQLNVMLGWTAALHAEALGSKRASRGLQMLERSARIQANLIDDLMDVSRIVTGQFRLHLQSVGLSEIVTSAIDAVGPAAGGNHIRMRAMVLPNIRVRGDSTRLQQVIANLLANALKFTRAGGRIDVRLERYGSDAHLVVRDNGVGIPANLIPRIFHRFEQIGRSVSGSAAGLGLGLAIVKEIVERHGGRIRATSQGRGLGATFTVTLPLIVNQRAN